MMSASLILMSSALAYICERELAKASSTCHKHTKCGQPTRATLPGAQWDSVRAVHVVSREPGAGDEHTSAELLRVDVPESRHRTSSFTLELMWATDGSEKEAMISRCGTRSFRQQGRRNSVKHHALDESKPEKCARRAKGDA